MNSQKSRLIAAASIIMFAASAFLSMAEPPTLKVGGKEDPDVYLQSLDIQVEVTGNLASTRYTMVFKNKSDRILEGVLTFPLPDGCSVTYYALDINGKMRDAVPADKATAAAIFEEIERRQVDPGLLEKVEGNSFRTRIYPIPANGTRTISIGYEEELTLENNLLRYRMQTVYPDPIENFSLKAAIWKGGLKPIVPESVDGLVFDKTGDGYTATFARQNYRPTRALNFDLPVPTDVPQVMMQPAQGSYYFFASVTPMLKTRKKCWSKNLAIIWDVSLSGLQRDLKRELEMLDIIFAEKKNVNVHLYFLNNTLTKITDKSTNKEVYKIRKGRWDGLKDVLEKATFDGGTDFSQINLKNIVGNEILFFSDGISTLSEADSIKNMTVKRPFHCVVSSARADYGAMKLIAGKTRGKFVNLDILSSDQLKNELLNETLQFFGAKHGESVREVYPSVTTPVHGSFSLSGISDVNAAEVTLLFGFGNKVKKRFKVRLNVKQASEQGNVRKIWAQKKIAELDLKYKKNLDELTALGQQFGIVTRNTSLIVLETLNDYIRYKIEPPSDLQEEYQKYLLTRKESEDKKPDMRRNLLKETMAAADTIRKWRMTDFSPQQLKYPTRPDPIPASILDSLRRRGVSGIGYGSGYGSGFGGGGGGVDDLLGGLMGAAGGRVEIRHHGCYLPMPNRSSSSNNAKTEPIITVKQIKKSNDYLNNLTGKTAVDYQLYLKLRADYIDSASFYFDMADWFYTHNDKKTAILVLTSIADLEIENASLYRLLGYKFKEYGEHALEKFVCKKVIQWRPMEPQSYRDYALALAGNGEAQAALDSLYSMLAKEYSWDIAARSHGIEEVAIMEINHLIAKNANLNKSKIKIRARINPRVNIRVVINWNMDNTDIDLHIKDPNNKECYYGHRETEIGGRMSKDITSGYGPEQFLLKKAIKGKYKVFVNYFGDRKFIEAGPATIMAEIYTKYAGKAEQRRIVCLQMSKAKRMAMERERENMSDGESEGDDADNSANDRDRDRNRKYVEVAEFEF